MSWSSRLQPTVAASTTEAEYMAASYATKEGLWLKKLMADFSKPVETLLIHTDNTAALSLLKNPVQSARSKHIDVLHHFARERVLRKEIKFDYVSTTDNTADCLTRALPDIKFSACRFSMGIH